MAKIVKKIIVLGAAGDGRNIADSIEDNILYKNEELKLIGFLDDDVNKQNLSINKYPVLGPLNYVNKYTDCYFISSFGSVINNNLKKAIINKLNLSIDKYITVKHYTSIISGYSKIGNGCFVGAGTIIGTNIKIGDHVKMLQSIVIGHDSIVSDYCSIANSVAIAGEVCIGKSCYIGMNVSIRENIRVGEGSILGMGSVIIKDVPPFSIVVGNPGRVIKKIKNK